MPVEGLRNRLVVDPKRLRDSTLAEAQALEVRDFRGYSLVQKLYCRDQGERQDDLGHGSDALRPCPPFRESQARRRETGGGPNRLQAPERFAGPGAGAWAGPGRAPPAGAGAAAGAGAGSAGAAAAASVGRAMLLLRNAARRPLLSTAFR